LSRGFTLIEVIVAVLLTSLVVILGFSAAKVSLDGGARLEHNLRALQSQRAVRQMIGDALRNAQLPQLPLDQGFELRNDRLTFVAASGTSPLDPDFDWLITLGPAGRRIEFEARPLGHAPDAQVRFSLPLVTRWDVRVMTSGTAAGWLREWPRSTLMPRAVEMRFWNDSLPVGPPLVVTLVP
jgi:prepilin-type N-terminal cleavage/methylation domain-containing protein